MKIGFNLLLWTTHLTEQHFPLLETLKATGYDGIEVPVFQGELSHYQHLGRVLRDQGLGCTSLTLLPDEAHSALSPDPLHRQGAVDHLRWTIDRSAALGSEMLIGPLYQELAVFTGRGPSEQEKAWVAEVHRQAADHAAAAGMVIAVEPLNRFECYFLNTMADAKAHVQRVDRPNFGAMYDTFHANIEEKDPIGCIAETADVIRHVHISENDRGTPGKGHIDFGATFKALRAVGYDGWLTIESFGQSLPEIQAAARIWRPLFPAEAEVYEVGFTTIREGWAAAA